MATAPLKKTAKQLQAEIDAANAIAEKARAELAKLETLTKLCEQFKKDVEAASFTLQDAIAELDQNYEKVRKSSASSGKKQVAKKVESKWGSLKANTTYADPEDQNRMHTTKDVVRRIPKLLVELTEKHQKPYSFFEVKQA